MKFGEWTKTEDELPPEPEMDIYGVPYLCTVDNKQLVAMYYVKTTVRGKEVIRWEWNGRISIWDVIAWMPFPEAYKED